VVGSHRSRGRLRTTRDDRLSAIPAQRRPVQGKFHRSRRGLLGRLLARVVEPRLRRSDPPRCRGHRAHSVEEVDAQLRHRIETESESESANPIPRSTAAERRQPRSRPAQVRRVDRATAREQLEELRDQLAEARGGEAVIQSWKPMSRKRLAASRPGISSAIGTRGLVGPRRR